jgi:hippurate hydrolase
VSFTRNYPPLINHENEVKFASAVMSELVGAQNVNTSIDPTMGAEDFAFMLLEKPGCYVFLGNGDGDHRAVGHGMGPCHLHNPSYDFNDSLIPVGVSYWVKLAQRYLEKN